MLAATGLLEGRRMTTHWRYAAALSRLHPGTTVDPDALYVDEGSILTSAGSAAAIDLCLHVVRTDWGPRIANTVARRLVVAPHRDGGQSQFIENVLDHENESTKTRAVVEWIRKHLCDELNVVELARLASMSERSFARHFKAEVGMTPARFVARERILRAQELLESTNFSVEEVAERCGFGSSLNLRHHFTRAVHLSPSAYRRRFRRSENVE